MAVSKPCRIPSSILRCERLEDRTTPTTVFAPDRVLVSVNPSVDNLQTLNAIRANAKTQSVRDLGAGVYLVQLKAGVPTANAIADFGTKPGVKYVKQDGFFQPHFTPNDPRYGDMWGLKNTGQGEGIPGADIGGEEGWDIGIGTGEMVVAVVDSGVQYDHPDLAANMWRDPTNPVSVGRDFGDNDADPYPDIPLGNGSNEGSLSHGTHVAGTIGAVGDNGIGMMGVALKTRMMALKIATGAGAGAFSSAQIEAINYAAEKGAKIVSMSYGHDASVLAPAIDNLRSTGGIFVVSAGNDASDTDFDLSGSLFTQDNVVRVAATDWQDKLASYSNFGMQTVNIGAPGGDINRYGVDEAGILSTFAFPKDSYSYLQGTSMATPMVSGALAAFWDTNPDLTYNEVLDIMYDTAKPVIDLEDKTSSGSIIDFGEMMASSKGQQIYATGAGAGGGPQVNVYSSRSRITGSFFAYDPGFVGGVRVAAGDVDGDGELDIIAAPGAGGGPHVKVFDSKTHAVKGEFFAYGALFSGGLYIATGDMDADGKAEIVVGADRGGGPRVTVFKRLDDGNFTAIADFFAFDMGFAGGIRVAMGDVDGDGRSDVVVAAGPTGGPHVKVFGGAQMLAGDYTPIRSFFAGSPTDTRGLFVATGEMSSQDYADIVVSSGADTPTVRVYDGLTNELNLAMTPSRGQGGAPSLIVGEFDDLQRAKQTVFLPDNLIPPATPGGIVNTSNESKPVTLNGYQRGARVASFDSNRDKIADFIISSGPADTPRVTVIDGATLKETRSYFAYDEAFFGGVFVGASGLSSAK